MSFLLIYYPINDCFCLFFVHGHFSFSFRSWIAKICKYWFNGRFSPVFYFLIKKNGSSLLFILFCGPEKTNGRASVFSRPVRTSLCCNRKPGIRSCRAFHLRECARRPCTGNVLTALVRLNRRWFLSFLDNAFYPDLVGFVLPFYFRLLLIWLNQLRNK